MLDPYQSGGFSGRVGYAPIDVEPDVIIITHDHLDHSHTETIPGQFDVIRYEGQTLGVPVRSVQVFHDMERGQRFGGVIDMKIFVVDGVTFCHCGDIGELLDDDEKVSAIGAIDVLIIPTGGYYTLGPEGAAHVTRRLNPKIVIPCHYKTEFCGFDIAPVEPFVDLFQRVRRVGSSRVALDKNAIPEDLECWVLDMTYARAHNSAESAPHP